jgi:uncharacterized pyridoxal phosphate-containing UPF0001 family protein
MTYFEKKTQRVQVQINSSNNKLIQQVREIIQISTGRNKDFRAAIKDTSGLVY